MKKYSLYFKIAFFITLSVVFVACEPRYEECTWEAQTIDMHAGLWKNATYNDDNAQVLNKNDSCSYDSITIGLFFRIETLQNQEICNLPHDSIIGKINELLVICTNDYNHIFNAYDTLNPILDILYTKTNFTMTESPINLQDYLVESPLCTKEIRIFLDSPPDTTRLQQFIIKYEEDDGTKYQDTTQPIYVKP